MIIMQTLMQQTLKKQNTRMVQWNPVDSTQPQLERSCAEARMT